MFAFKESLPLFPTTLWSFQIPADASARMNSGITDKLDRLIAAAPNPSHKGMWQTEHDLHTLPEMEELNGYFMNAVNDVMGAIETKQKDMEITGCWANIGPPKQSHGSHMHGNNFLSAVYYVVAPPGGDRITFYDPRAHIHIIAPEVERLNSLNADYVNVGVKVGMLLLFPAWLVHSVPDNAAEERRISIAFNVNFRNFTETLSPPSWEPNLSTHP